MAITLLIPNEIKFINFKNFKCFPLSKIEYNMKSKLRTFLFVGLIAFGAGVYLYLSNKSAEIDQQNIEIVTNATNAEDAARQISENNRKDVGGNSIAMFLLGLGGAMVIFSGFSLMRRK